MANGTSPASILVTWDLPSYPNGPIGSYRVLYRQSDSVQTPPINSDQYTQTTVEERQFEITGLTPFTNYSIHVQTIGSGRSQGELQGAIVEEVLALTCTEKYLHIYLQLRQPHLCYFNQLLLTVW